MTAGVGVSDLIVLVADNDMMLTMETLLNRREALGLACFDFVVERHLERDPGCRNDAVEVLRPHLGKYNHCLVMFDYEGCGSRRPRAKIQERVERDLARNGWGDRARAIVIQPELEAWVWGDLATAAKVLGWAGNHRHMRALLTRRGLWPDGQPKPMQPKTAMREVVRGAPSNQPLRRPQMLQAMARTANIDKCRDPAFQELLSTLRRWFPPHGSRT